MKKKSQTKRSRGRSTVAGRLVGAFRNIGRNRVADATVDTMRILGTQYMNLTPSKRKRRFPLGCARSLVAVAWYEISPLNLSAIFLL